MEETLDAALSKIFGDVGASGEAAPVQNRPDLLLLRRKGVLLRLPGEHFERAMTAQREGNWALYGDEIKKLGEVIKDAEVTLIKSCMQLSR